ncbi:MAG: 2-C-methyl-D-erythritol 4-phosphate cytidylyltransferase [Nitrospirota bacterium]
MTLRRTPQGTVTAAVIVAAGRGLRMAQSSANGQPGAASRSKQYLVLAGRPILAHTIGRFDAHRAIDQIVLIVPPGDEPMVRREIVEAFGFRKVTAIRAGGEQRQDSVAEGLAAIPSRAELVAVHDGVRPCVTPEQIDAVIEAVSDAGGRADGAVLAVPLKDTPKQVGPDGVIQRTLHRGTLWLAQTPQVYRAAVLREAYIRAAADGYRGTDDAALVERLGYRVVVVEGAPSNVKITLPDDLPAAEQWLLGRSAALQSAGRSAS